MRKPSRSFTPIEPHYSPCHKNVQRVLYPRREKEITLPTISEAPEGRKTPFFTSPLKVLPPNTGKKARARWMAQTALSKLENLTLVEKDKRSSVEIVPDSQDGAENRAQPDGPSKQRTGSLFLRSVSCSSTGGTQLVLPEQPEYALTPRTAFPRSLLIIAV